MSKKFINNMISEMRSAYQISRPGTAEDLTEAVTRLARDKTLSKSRNWRTRRVQESINARDRSKRVCPPGYEYDPSRKDCVPVRGGVSGGRLSGGGNRDDAPGSFSGRVYGSHGQNGAPRAWEERPTGHGLYMYRDGDMGTSGWSDQFNGGLGSNPMQVGEEKTCGNCKKRKCACKTFRNFSNPNALMHHTAPISMNQVDDARDDHEGDGGDMTEGWMREVNKLSLRISALKEYFDQGLVSEAHFRAEANRIRRKRDLLRKERNKAMLEQSPVSNYTTPARPKMPSGGYTQRSDNRGPTAGRDAPMGRARNPRRKKQISESSCPRCSSSKCRCLGNRALID